MFSRRALALALLVSLSACAPRRSEPESSLLPALAAARFVDRSLTPGLLRRSLGELEADSQSWTVDEEQETIKLRGGGTLVVPLRLAGVERELRFDLHSHGDGGRLRLAMLDAAGARRELGVVDAPAAGARVRFGEPAGGLHFLLLESDRSSGRLSLEHPRLLPAPLPRSSRATEEVSDPPHLVILVLDAARADHFGCYGYDRDTTPHIDALAAESHIFRRAYAECPSTACSMPGLLTGTPFLADGEPGRRLAGEVTTLAEALSEVGDYTVSLSANPNNSIGRGLAQGFATFERM